MQSAAQGEIAPSKGETALNSALRIAEAFCDAAAGCGVVGVESAAGLLKVVVQQIQIVYENAKKCKELVDAITKLTTVLDNALAALGPSTEGRRATIARLGSENDFRARIEDLSAALRRVEGPARKLADKASRKGLKAAFKNHWFATPKKALLAALVEDVNQATHDFAFRGGIAIEFLLRNLVERFECRERDAEWKDLLRRLPHANATYLAYAHSSVRRPLSGTRVDLLKDIDDWATCDSTSQPFYVLTGGAGTGKSTIAREVAESAVQRRNVGEKGQLGACFFFKKGEAELNSAEVVFPTLAWQLLSCVPALRPTAIPTIEQYLALGGVAKLDVQAEHLFVGLLSNLRRDHPPLVIVIDAVDECTTTAQELIKEMLRLMMEGLEHVACSIRIFVTSRPELHIEHALRSPPFATSSISPTSVTRLRRFRLHQIPQDVLDHDINLYFETELQSGGTQVVFQGVDVVQRLTSLAGGLFIYATTIVQYVRLCAAEGSVPDLAPLLADEHTAPQLALDQLGNLYTFVLDRGPLGASDARKALASMKIVLGYIAVLQDPLSPNALIALSPNDLKDHILPTLRRLAPVLSCDPEQGDLPVRPLHASFVDFLLNPNPSGAEHRVWVSEQDLRLAIATLELLEDAETVAQYISHVQKSRLHSVVSNVESSPSNFVPDAMQYACLYWPAHVTRYIEANIHLALTQEPTSKRHSESDVRKLIHDYQAVASAFFVPVHIIRWIEVLGYLQRLGTATDWLPTLRRVFADLDKSLADMFYDAYRLVIAFYPALVDNPCQLYISALPQSPDTSALRACIPPALAVPRSLLPYPAWSPSVTHETEQLPKTGRPYEYRWVIRPSPDGKWVAASLRSGRDRRGDIYLRDAATGIVLRTLPVHASGLADIGISSDSRFIVSATRDGEICITDSNSGIPVVRYNHSYGEVTRVAFRCKDSELLLVHAHQGYRLDRPVHFLILDWDRTERTQGELRPRWESHGLRDDTSYRPDPTLWSISPDGRWGVFWATGDLLDLRSFAEVKLSFIPDTAALSYRDVNTCGAWLSPSSLVCSVPHKDGRSLIVVDIGQDIKEVETRAIRSLPAPYTFSAMEASANGSLVALHGDTSSGDCIFLWNPNGDEIRLIKHAWNCGFCLSPHGDALYLAVDSNWSVIPTSPLSIATAQPLHSRALKFSATRDTIMVATARPAHALGWEVGILSRGFSSSPGTASVVSRHYFGRRPLGDSALTPDPHSMIFPDNDVVLQSMVHSRKIFPDWSRRGEHKGYPTSWWYAAMSPNLSCIVACGFTPDVPDSRLQELTFAVWDTESASLLHTFRTPKPFLPDYENRRTEIVVTKELDIHYLLDHHSFVYRYSDWSTSDPDEPRLLPTPEPGPVPGEWFQIGDDGWVARSDGHPEADKPGRGREKLFWIPPSQRVKQLWRGDQNLLAMTTEYDVIVLDLSDFDDDTKEQHVPRLQIENE